MRTNRDVGAGYVYAVLVEAAKVVRKEGKLSGARERANSVLLSDGDHADNRKLPEDRVTADQAD